jgi:hypothetical protein
MGVNERTLRYIRQSVYRRLGIGGDNTTKRVRAMLWLLIIGEIAPGDLEIHHVKRREDY